MATDRGHDDARVGQQTGARRGQHHRARQPIEQLLIQFLFQLMDLLAKRRLRHMLPLRRLRIRGEGMPRIDRKQRGQLARARERK